MFGGKGGLGNLMKQAQQMQDKMQKMQEEIAQRGEAARPGFPSRRCPGRKS